MEELILHGLEGLIALLVGGNLFFVRRLISKVEPITQQIPLIQGQVGHLEKRFDELSQNIREFSELKKDVAVLKYAVRQMGGGSSHVGLSESDLFTS